MAQLGPGDYTVGWICAIQVEFIAAQEFLDEEHDEPEYVPQHDNNSYALGRVGKHNVVIATLPMGTYGTTSAATVARDMMRTFPNIRIGLMVGIGGGAPSERHDIRLGDIVVGTPGNGEGGVIQYDFGKNIQDQAFKTSGFLNQPPTFLQTALAKLQARYVRKGHKLESTINGILEKNERLRKQFQRPLASTDVLYKTEVAHPDTRENCTAVCNESGVRSRPERTTEELEIHYGLIASANQLMKNADYRDSLAEKRDVLCFEMEAAGLMNHFPCIVIRGICDYSDSHKNKEWQGFAAMMAAAFAKDLLDQILPNKVEAERKIRDILEGLQIAAEDHRDISKKLAQTQKIQIEMQLSKEEQKCHQTFRRTSSSSDTTYEWYKDRVDQRIEGTCIWFLEHQNFKTWLKQDSGPLLVSADPGCGKSVLAKYLIDQVLPTPEAIICYFFFKEGDQNTLAQALCAILHQLFSQKKFLLKHAMERYKKEGEKLSNSTNSLWTILLDSAKDPLAGPIIIVLDALDECTTAEFIKLMRNLDNQFCNSLRSQGKLRYLLTSRPYTNILSKFHKLLSSFQNIHIPGGERSDAISQEVGHVITYRADELSDRKMLSSELRDRLKQKLQEGRHRTYLWVYLVFDYLEQDDFKKTSRGIDSALAILPKSVNEAYERILNKTKNYEIVRKALCIVLAAGRPLTLSEMNIAMSIDKGHQSFDDLDLENNRDFEIRLRSVCGLFLSIHQSSIYFLHQTAREFLLSEAGVTPTIFPASRWHHSIAIKDACSVLAELCIIYLKFFNSDASSIASDASGIADTKNAIDGPLDINAFLDYSACNWGNHFRHAGIAESATITHSASELYDPNTKSYWIWSKIYCLQEDTSINRSVSNLGLASENGNHVIVKLLIDKGADIEARDNSSRTPLSWAAENGHEAVVRLLLENGADLEARDDDYSQTPLLWAARNGHKAVVRLLLENGADLEARDEYSRTPLSLAAENGDEAVVRLLLENGADLEARDEYSRTPLSLAAENGHEAVIRPLLKNSADLEARDEYSRTPLSWAAEEGHKAVVRLLLENGADLEARDEYSQTPLSLAAIMGHEAVIRLLLENGADLEARDEYSRTPLSLAAESGYEAVVRLLLENGADLEARDDDYSQTPLSWAAENGYEAVVRLLLENSADLEARDKVNRTPLIWAAIYGHKAVVRLLLENGADLEARDDDYSQIPLSWAAKNGHEAVARLLLKNSADLEARDEYSQTPLSLAAMRGHEAVIRLLLENGADLEARDEYSRTPLSLAAENGHEAVIRLLKNGADLEARKKKLKIRHSF